MKKLTILIPCYNEESGIGAVISGFQAEYLHEKGLELDIIVIDNNSNDATAAIAKAHGATVISENKKGKGNAMRAGFAALAYDTDYVVMLDGDNTYRPTEILRMLEPLQSNFATVVLGSRLYGNKSEGSMKGFNKFGNHIFTILVRTFFKVPVTDVLTGYYAWKYSAVKKLLPHLTSEGFTIEIEMVTKMARLGEQISSVPISYDKRAGASNLKPVEDGIKIMRVLLRNIFWQPNVKNMFAHKSEFSNEVLVKN